jgi:toxin ParE1/3/4
MAIIWNDDSVTDVQEIGSYIAESNPENANNFIDELIESIEKLDDFPALGRLVKEDPFLRELIINSYRAIYQIQGSDIRIIAIVSSRQDFSFN